MASLGWIHFSKSFRDRVNTILDLMDEEGMVDELGIGAFRGAFADIFFPGISTIQRSAKYFFIVPYLIKDYSNLPANKQNGLNKYLDKEEHEIIWELAARYDYDRRAGSGVIGITKKPGKRIGTRPSSIYWTGLRTLGFINTKLSLGEYSVRINESVAAKFSRTISDRTEDSDDEDVELSDGNGIKVSTYRKNWKQKLDIPLEYEEADFFRQQIIRSVPDTLLGQIVLNETLRRKFFRSSDFRSFVPLALNEKLADELKANLILAHDLDVVVEGMYWVYSNEINKLYYKEETHYEKWKEWKSELYSQIIDLPNLKGETLVFIAPRSHPSSKQFIIKMLEMIRQKNISYKAMAELVIEQERNVKPDKSRFKPNVEIDFKKGEGKSLSYLNYRYGNATSIIKDIFKNLNLYNA
jgi:hypothetical protein